ncbi:HEAT repeat domain-containing protein [Chitinivorax sp. PXF-14]|uniref:HEAT repeat domain-containing protein n=1 Tax=Chitinivorax sp. PXF-14 TaxID=3230488 RepID=UPI003467E271
MPELNGTTADTSQDLAVLELTDNAALRNTLAMRLAETKRPDVLTVLLRLISKPELSNARATLVHCLGFYNLADHFDLLVGLVASGNWEVAHEAHGLLSSIEEVNGDDVAKAYDLIKGLLYQGVPDGWRKDLLQDLLSMFE